MSETLSVLAENFEAKDEHSLGQECSLDFKEYFSADGHYQSALDILGSDKDLGSLDKTIQSARIIRDKGFNRLRSVIDFYYISGDSELKEIDATWSLKDSRDLVSKSKSLTNILIFNPDTASPDTDLGKVKPNLYAEHGATIGLLGRLATAGTVVFKEPRPEAADVNRYSQAHDLLKQANNGYYLVGNAILAARHERIFGTRRDSILWASRAVKGLLWTGSQDRLNLKAATLTLGSRTLDLLTRSRAIKSVYTKP